MKRKVYAVRGSKWVLAIALFLVFSLVLSPFASAAKNSENGKKDGGQDGADDNTQAPEKNHKGDNGAHKRDEDKENKVKEDKHEPENKTPADNNLGQDQPDEPGNDIPSQIDNNTQEQLDNTTQGQPENDVSEQLEQPVDNVQDQPENTGDQGHLDNEFDDQPEQPSNDFGHQPGQPGNSGQQARNDPQPGATLQNDQSHSENQGEPEAENLNIGQVSEVLETKGSVGQTAKNDQPQEMEENLSDQTNSQQNQAAAGITLESGVSSVSLFFSDGLSILGVGFGIVVLFRLSQIWVQQKYLFQIFHLKISLSRMISSVRLSLWKVYLLHLHFGKIKCRTGFTKEEVLAFFSECQRLPLSWNNQYG